MAKFQKIDVVPVATNSRAVGMGFASKKCARVVLDQEFPMLSKWIYVGVQGDVMWVGVDDSVNLLANAVVGYHPIVSKKIITIGTSWDGISGGTTAGIIHWFGGL